jgi:catechol 2,3-dioxygenase-like lactoylglutathione lyase family enzyme
MRDPLFRKIDAYLIRADDLDAATAFYRERLGHPVIWRTSEAVAFRLPETDAELVVHRHLEPELDLLVRDADRAYADLIAAGAKSLIPPFDIAIGRCAKIEDPFGNRLTILDQSKGKLATDADHNVVGVVGR